MLGGLVLALMAAGCGSDDGGDGIATAGGPTVDASASARPASDPEDAQEQQLRFAQCMREHGVDMPDPEVNDSGGTSITIPDGTDPQQVDAATEQCKQHLPNGGEPQPVDPEMLERTREFSKCMRANGIPNFPDPGEDGGIQINPDELGVGPGDPAMQAAEEACKQYMGPEDGGGGAEARLDSRTS
ncbi:MAG: hypothetical protein IRZ08_06700 [Frankia sp.]|nr:hypothetical protein [Frankia sp.]